MQLNTTLENFLGSESDSTISNGDMCAVLRCLGDSAAALAQRISQNSFSDLQNSIELIAFGLFEEHLRDAPIGMLFSEKFDTPRVQNPESDFGVVIHPLEGAPNIGSAMPFGSLFSIHSTGESVTMEGLSSATLRAAGFFVYGAQTLLVLGIGEGASLFALNPETGEFELRQEHLRIPEQQREFAIDGSNYRFWDSGVRHYVDACIAGAEGPLGADFEMSWNASVVVEAYRILTRGGVYLYPDDARPGFENGKHKLLYEAMPIAFLMERAGGKAADGYERILDKEITGIDTRVPLIFGSADAVDLVLEYVSNDPTETTRFPLFENRSLFRN